MGLLGDGAVGHRPGAEAFDDLLDRLDLLDWYGVAQVVAEVQRRADGARAVVLHPRGVGVELRAVVRPYRLLQQVNDLGAVQVLLGLIAAAQPVPADGRQPRPDGVLKRRVVPVAAVGLHVVQALPAQRAGGVGEVLVHKLRIKPHRLEELGALVRLQRGHAHLGGDLQDPRRKRLVVVFDARLAAFPADDVVGEVRVHRPRAVGDQHRKLVGVAGLAALQQDGDRRALLDVDEVLLQRGHR